MSTVTAAAVPAGLRRLRQRVLPHYPDTIPPPQAAAKLASLPAVPPADLACLSANAAKVAQAAKDNSGQWQRWWRICFLCQLLFIPFVFVMAGHWNPRKARGRAGARAHGRPRAGAAARRPRGPGHRGQAVVIAHGYAGHRRQTIRKAGQK
jgi:hypothetical protein